MGELLATQSPAVFLDRDGVLIDDVPLLTRADQVHLAAGAAWAVAALRAAGYLTVVVSNQPVVARGLLSEDGVVAVNNWIQELLVRAEGSGVDAFYFCPHHPNATLPQYRLDCDCRKPRPGLLRRAAGELHIAMSSSYMIGDRLTDIIAGQRAGCTTILIRSGRHADPPIETPDKIDIGCLPDHTCDNLRQAAEWILRRDE